MDTIAGAFVVPRHDVLQYGNQCTDKFFVRCVPVIFINSKKEPEGGVYGIKFRRLTVIRKSIRYHALTDTFSKRSKDYFSVLHPADRQAKPRNGNHSVAAPIAKPRVTRNHRLPVMATLHDKLIGSQHESFDFFIPKILLGQ